MNVSERMSKVHLWIGVTQKTEEEYLEYFKLDYSTGGDFDDPNYQVCGFCIDIGEKWYDEDFIGIIPLYEEEVSIKEIIEEAAIDPKESENVILECERLGLKKANAILWYSDAEIEITQPHKDSYNDLKYIGMFEGD